MSMGQSDGVSRICVGCGASAPGMVPVGWIIEPVKTPIGPGFMPMVVGERPLCLDCQHPELQE